MTATQEIQLTDPLVKNTLADSLVENAYIPDKNLCVICGTDMGDCNPRQLCGKTHCLFPPLDMVESQEVSEDGFYLGLNTERCAVCNDPVTMGKLCGLIYCLHTLEKLKTPTNGPEFKLQLIEEGVRCAICNTDMGETTDTLCGKDHCINPFDTS